MMGMYCVWELRRVLVGNERESREGTSLSPLFLRGRAGLYAELGGGAAGERRDCERWSWKQQRNLSARRHEQKKDEDWEN
jgi:hypothetical protein